MQYTDKLHSTVCMHACVLCMYLVYLCQVPLKINHQSFDTNNLLRQTPESVMIKHSSSFKKLPKAEKRANLSKPGQRAAAAQKKTTAAATSVDV